MPVKDGGARRAESRDVGEHAAVEARDGTLPVRLLGEQESEERIVAERPHRDADGLLEAAPHE